MDSEKKLAPSNSRDNSTLNVKLNGPSLKHDPYEFSEEASTGIGGFGKGARLRSSQDSLSMDKAFTSSFEVKYNSNVMIFRSISM